MLYLLDSNVLITASKTYYQIDRVPEFWDWLIHMGEQGNIKIVKEVYEEITNGTDALKDWARQEEVEAALRFDGLADIGLVRRVIANGYAPDLTDEEIEKVGRDPFLIAYALADVGNRTIVTTEVSKPRRVRANRHIPDVCASLGVPCLNTFDLTTALNFRTDWQRG